MLIKVTREPNPITRDFRESEFFTKDPDFREDFHYLDVRLIKAVQIIRARYHTRIRITSTFRTPEYNIKIGSKARESYHLKGRALDFQFMDNNANLIRDLERDIKTNGPIRQELEALGIRGFLFYNTFIHLDTRDHLFIKRYP